MVEINLSEFKKYSSNITFKETNTGYTIRISRSNWGALILSLFTFTFALMAFIYAFEVPLLFILSCLLFYLAYYLLKLTFGYLEIRMYECYIQFIWDNEIKKGLKGETVNINEIRNVRLEKVEYSEGSVPYLQINFKDNTSKSYSCVDPEYTPCISIFIKKYMKEYYK
jgi:hypothetical protein